MHRQLKEGESAGTFFESLTSGLWEESDLPPLRCRLHVQVCVHSIQIEYAKVRKDGLKAVVSSMEQQPKKSANIFPGHAFGSYLRAKLTLAPNDHIFDIPTTTLCVV